MQFDMRELGLGARYKIVNSTITPRPIAWVTTLGANGMINAAPYSFFNCVGVEPPLVVLGLLKDMQTRQLKDTATNIAANGEFTVNLVCEADAETMNLSSVDAPRDVSEIDYAGIATLPSTAVAPPRIASSPVSFECRKLEMLDIGLQNVVIGEILVAHIADEFISQSGKALSRYAGHEADRAHAWQRLVCAHQRPVCAGAAEVRCGLGQGEAELMEMTDTPAARLWPKSTIAWLTVAILFLLYIRSLADRYLMALMVEPIKADLGLSDLQISLLQGPAFAVLYAICAIPVGLLLDRSSRRWVLFGCIVVWSSGAAACGLAASFAMLALGRSLVGAGESGYTTGAYSIIGDSFPPERVSFAMSIFVMGGVMGAGIVFLLGGPLVGAGARRRDRPLAGDGRFQAVAAGLHHHRRARHPHRAAGVPVSRAQAAETLGGQAGGRRLWRGDALHHGPPALLCRDHSGHRLRLCGDHRPAAVEPELSYPGAWLDARRRSASPWASPRCCRRSACRCTAGWSIGSMRAGAAMRICCGA